jgi:hypothetical protein
MNNYQNNFSILDLKSCNYMKIYQVFKGLFSYNNHLSFQNKIIYIF